MVHAARQPLGSVLEIRPVFPLALRQRRGLRLALLAAALNALTPLFASAQHAADGLPFEVCSVNGSAAEGGAPLPEAPDGKSAHPAHCALCSASGAKFAALPGAASAPFDPLAAAEEPPVARAVPRAHASPYLPAHPRAPPHSLIG